MIRPEGKQITHFFGVFFPLLLTQFALVGSSLFSSIFSGNAGTTDLAGVAVWKLGLEPREIWDVISYK